MKQAIQCSKDLGIKNCDFVARGKTPGDVLNQIVEHLRDEHELSMPEPDVILRGRTLADPLVPEADKAASLVIRRLREALDIEPTDGTKVAGPTLGRLTSN